MPSEKEQSRRSGTTTSQRPERNRANAPLNPPPGGKKPSGPKKSSLKNTLENIGWGLVIGLPVILVILAIAFRATNGFQSTPDVNSAIPTPVPSPTAGQPVAAPATSGNKDRLLYIAAPGVTNPQQIYSSKADGTGQYQITNSRDNKAGASWSPDGKQIVFTADSVGVQMVNFDGSGLRTVAYGGYSPVWSPDGKQIAFLKNVAAPDGQGPDKTGNVRVLYVTKVDGTPGTERQLASDVLGQNWSPDSKSLVFFSQRNAVMFTVEAESGKTEQVKLPQALGVWYPVFAPDGNSIVFYGNPNPAAMVAALDLSISTTNLEGTIVPTATPAPTVTAAPTATVSGTVTAGPTATPAPTVTPTPTPSPIPGPTSQMGLYQVNRDGSNLKKLADLEPADGKGGGTYRFYYYVATSLESQSILSARPFYKVTPVWSPDGKNIATLFVDSNNKAGLALVPAAGGQPLPVVEGQNNLEQGLRVNPSWSSDSSKLYYTFVPPKPANATSGVAGQIATGQTPGAAIPVLNKPARAFDVNAKTEQVQLLSGKDDYSFVGCCGFGK